MRRQLSLCLLVLLIGVSGEALNSETSPEALSYLDAAIDVMQAHSLRRGEVDWASLRAQATAKSRGAQSCAETYGAIRWALGELGDQHSMLLGAVDAQALQGADLTEESRPRGELVEERIGHLVLPPFAGSQEASAAYAQALHESICSLRSQGADRWIVNLRDNFGGDMWGMLAGIGPVLGEGTCGRFVDPIGAVQTWSYRAGGAFCCGELQVAVEESRTCLSPEAVESVAILTNRRTCSSGEAIAIAFKGRDRARSFGEITCGLSTANESFVLRDGAIMLLTVSTFADREGTLYGSFVRPDKTVSGYKGLQAAVDEAVKWLLLED